MIINKLWDILRWFIVITAFIGMFTLFVWVVFAKNPIDFKPGDLPVGEKEVRTGGYINYWIDYCKYSTHIPLVSKTFVDGLTYTIPESPAVEKKIGCDKVKIQQYVPKGIPPGEYYIGITYHYQINPVVHIDKTIKTEKFTVINGSK